MARPFRFGCQSYAATSAADWRDQARVAEALGYSTFSLADHYIGPGPALDPTNHPVQVVAAVPAMAVAAEVTDSIRIGCRVFCVGYHNPVVLAKELATLDFLSDGRLEIGLGAGWVANEYEAIGIPFDRGGTRIDRLDETLRVIRACFGDGMVDVTGEHVHAVGFEGLPKPVQQPLPPVMIGGGSPRILALAGREAEIVSINFDNRSGRIGPEGIGSGTAEGTGRKLDWIKQGAGERYADLEIEIAAYFTVVTDQRDATLEAMAGGFGLVPEELAEHPHALIGSVDQICEQLEQRRETLDISYVTVGGRVMEDFAPVVQRLAGT